MQDIIDQLPLEWHARCGQRGCPWGRWFGEDLAEANRQAEKHRQRKGANHGSTIRYDKVTANGRGTWFV